MKEKHMRYTRFADFIELLMMLQQPKGVTFKDVQEHFNVSRRTAERMIHCILSVLPQVDDLELDDKQKHWGFINFNIGKIVVIKSPA